MYRSRKIKTPLLESHPDCITVMETGKQEDEKLCSECGRSLDWRGKCHECLNNQFLDEEYEIYNDRQNSEGDENGS